MIHEPRSTTSQQEHRTVLHIARNDLFHASRIGRTCRAVRERYPQLDQVVVGLQTGSLPERETDSSGAAYYRLAAPPRTLLCRGPRRTRAWDRAVTAHFADWNLRVVSAHSVWVLAVAATLASKTKAVLLYEPHELESQTNGAPWWQRMLARNIERRLIRTCRGVVVVSEAIADWYAQAYNMARPVVVRNLPEVTEVQPTPDPRIWRDRFGIPDHHVIFVYQGLFVRGRRIEQFIRVFAKTTPDRHLVFLGYGDLEEEVRLAAARHPNIHYAPAVPPSEILRHTSGANVGLVGVENVSLSDYYSLPNKLFEYLRAGLPVMMPNFPEMLKVLDESKCGWVIGESDGDWLTAINGIDWGQVRECRSRVHAAAGRFSWDQERAKLLDMYATFPNLA